MEMQRVLCVRERNEKSWNIESKEIKSNCKDRIWIPSPTGRWIEAQINEFVENGLENWALMN